MADPEIPRTRLEQLLRQRRMTVDEFRRRYCRLSATELSERQAYRWIAGELQGLPYPHAQAALEQLLGEPAPRLFGKPYGAGSPAPVRRQPIRESQRGSVRQDWQGQVVTMSAERARDFLNRAEESNVGSETIEQLADDVRRLAIAYQQQELESLLGDLVDVQDRAFGLLEGRQRPSQTQDLYMLAGVASGLMAKASHDLGASHDAMTQARAAYACADNSGHNGLRAWTRGLQSLIAYWAGHFDASLRYAGLGEKVMGDAPSTAAVWLSAARARAWAAQGRFDEAELAVQRANDLREQVVEDEIDKFGGVCSFSRPRQLYYAAGALAWGDVNRARRTELVAASALEAYERAPRHERAFSDEAGTRCALGVSRALRGEVEGAADAVAPVLELARARRIHGVVTSVEHVHHAVARLNDSGRRAAELADALHTFAAERIALPQR